MKLIRSFLTIVLIFSLTIGISLAGDVSYVIHIKGTVTNKATGATLKIGDKINSDDQLKFSSQDGLVVIMSSKGKYTLSPSSKATQSNEFLAYVEDAMIPLKSNGHLSTRGNKMETIYDLKGYFGTSTFNILGDQLDIRIDTLKYPITDSKYFIYRYVNNGSVVSKKMERRKGHLIINKNSLYTVKGIYIDPSKIQNVEIYYFDSLNNKSSKLVQFNPQFLNEEQLKSELMIQKKILEDQKFSSDQITKELVAFVFDVYGKTDENKLDEWMHLNLR